MRLALGILVALGALVLYAGDLRRVRERWQGPPRVRWIRQGAHWCFHIETTNRRRAIETLLQLAQPPARYSRRQPWA